MHSLAVRARKRNLQETQLPKVHTTLAYYVKTTGIHNAANLIYTVNVLSIEYILFTIIIGDNILTF